MSILHRAVDELRKIVDKRFPKRYKRDVIRKVIGNGLYIDYVQYASVYLFHDKERNAILLDPYYHVLDSYGFHGLKKIDILYLEGENLVFNTGLFNITRDTMTLKDDFLFRRMQLAYQNQMEGMFRLFAAKYGSHDFLISDLEGALRSMARKRKSFLDIEDGEVLLAGLLVHSGRSFVESFTWSRPEELRERAFAAKKLWRKIVKEENNR